MGKWLNRLEEIIRPCIEELTKPTEDPFVGNVSASSRGIGGNRGFDGLHQEIANSKSLAALKAICTRIDADCRNGHITQHEAEELAIEITQKARLLPERCEDDGATEEMHLSDMCNAKPIRRVRSKILGEDVLWVADNAEIPVGNDLMVYRESELKELVGLEPAALRAIHKAKRYLDVELVGSAPSFE